MAPEKEPSSSSQNSPEPSGLLKTLAAAFSGVLFGLFLSKFDTPTEKDRESVHPQNNPRPETSFSQLQVPIAPQIPPAPTQHYQPDRRKDNTPKWKKRTEIAAVIIAGVLLVANLFVTVGTWKASKAAKDSVDLARKNAHFEHRAWLGISYGIYKYAANQTLGTTYEITDTGKTPARNVNGMAVTRFMTLNTTPVFTYEHGTAADLGTMLPGVHQGAVSWLLPPNVPKGVRIEPLIISDEMVRELKKGTGYVMLYGSISYDSVFGAHHWIKFCAASGPTNFTQPKECIDYNNVDNNEEP